MYTELRNLIKLVINIVCTNGSGVRSNICSPVVIRVTHASDILCVGYTRTMTLTACYLQRLLGLHLRNAFAFDS